MFASRLLALQERTINDLRAQLHDERLRTASLTEVIVNLKVSGAQPQRPLGQKPERRELSDIEKAIERSRGLRGNTDAKMRAAKWAENQIANNVDRELVLAQLTNWDVVPNEVEEEIEDDDTIELGI